MPAIFPSINNRTSLRTITLHANRPRNMQIYVGWWVLILFYIHPLQECYSVDLVIYLPLERVCQFPFVISSKWSFISRVHHEWIKPRPQYFPSLYIYNLFVANQFPPAGGLVTLKVNS